MTLIDTHAHINFNAYKDDADEVIKRSLQEGVFMVNVGSQYSTSQRAVEIAQKYEGLYAAAGLHPIHLNDEEFDHAKYSELAKNDKVVAIGEVGLDYKHFEEGDNIPVLIEKQKKIFGEFIKIANEVQKPLLVHCWGNYGETKAYDELYEILKNNPVVKAGVIHSFMGSHKTAKKFTEIGYKIGLNGIITYSESYDRLIKELALEDMVLETDCPYLTPVPHKGERNEPIHVKLVAEKIAALKGVEAAAVAAITTENAKKILHL